MTYEPMYTYIHNAESTPLVSETFISSEEHPNSL